MAITLAAATDTAAINAACDAIVDLVDVSGPGVILLELANQTTEVATLTFAATAFGAAVAGVATANAIVNDASATGNAAAVTTFEVRDGAAAEIWTGTVAESGADLNIDDGTPGGGVIIGAGAVVSISTMTFTVAFV